MFIRTKIAAFALTGFIALAPLQAEAAAPPIDIESCQNAHMVDQVIESEFKKLARNYPGTLLYYGLSAAVLSEVQPDEVGEVLLALSAMQLGCYFLIDADSCNHVARRLGLFLTFAAVSNAYQDANQCT